MPGWISAVPPEQAIKQQLQTRIRQFAPCSPTPMRKTSRIPSTATALSHALLPLPLRRVCSTQSRATTFSRRLNTPVQTTQKSDSAARSPTTQRATQAFHLVLVVRSARPPWPFQTILASAPGPMNSLRVISASFFLVVLMPSPQRLLKRLTLELAQH